MRSFAHKQNNVRFPIDLKETRALLRRLRSFTKLSGLAKPSTMSTLCVQLAELLGLSNKALDLSLLYYRVVFFQSTKLLVKQKLFL